MATLFVSHSSSDQAASKRVAERLRAEGYAALFLDFDPADGIPAGRNWKRELFAQLRKADGVIFMASAASVASQSCITEVGLAQSLGKPVFPLRLEPGVRLGPIDDVQWIDLSEDEIGLARLVAGLWRAGLDAADSFTWDPTRSPYPGLESFSRDDAAVFFGRADEIDRLLELLQPTLQRGSWPLRGRHRPVGQRQVFADASRVAAASGAAGLALGGVAGACAGSAAHP